MAGALAEKWKFDLDGGTVALDFVNTLSGMRGVQTSEHLFAWADLVYWAEQAGLLSKAQARQRQAWAGLHPRESARAFQEAIRLREALHDVVQAAIEKRASPARALGEVKEWIVEAHAGHHLDLAGPGRFRKIFDLDADTLAFLWPVALDAEELLLRELPEGRARICEESAVGRCGWLFLDETRNHSRRYCSMSECGNRAKQRRFQARRRAEH